MEKAKIEYRAERRNKTRGIKKESSLVLPFNSEHKPFTKDYAIDLAKNMLTYCSDFTHIKKITGLSIKNMIQLNLIEYYHPFKRWAINPNSTGLSDRMIKVIDTGTTWLRRKA